MDNEDAVLNAIRLYVWSGFYGADKVVEIVDETIVQPGEIDQDWLRAKVKEAFGKKWAEEKTWPSVTDCDRLDRVFKRLRDQGILALQNAGYTQSDGLDDVSQFYREAGGKQSGIEGYCFYHGQDLERVVESGNLWLAFGHVSADDEKAVEIGKRIRHSLEDAGFAVEWQESRKTRLSVTGIKWQRRRRRNS